VPSIPAALCYFLAVAGFVWLLCERSSDWGTPRWGNQLRAFALLGAAIAWLVAVSKVGHHFAGTSRVPDVPLYYWAIGSGLAAGGLGYWLVRSFVFPRRRPKDAV
jgi:hypothetical protein